jgi:hypothetical protein
MRFYCRLNYIFDRIDMICRIIPAAAKIKISL